MKRRSQLYVPANNMKMIQKSTTLDADSIVFDLEDAVPSNEKENARNTLAKALSELEWNGKELCVRINSINDKNGIKDLEFVMSLDKINTILVPKAEQDLSFIYKSTGKNIIPIIETSKGVVNIENVIRSEGVVAVTYGAADLALSVYGDIKEYEKNIYIKTLIVLNAKAYDIDAIDKVYFDLKDLEGFKNEALEAKRLGYVGKQVIHPSQISIANEVFTPSKEEVEWAKKVISAYEEMIKQGKGALRVDDKLVDAVHYKLAKKILELSGSS
ncbi:MAG: CoA ester lyase [Sulfolobaceae archaeon]|nr:CoA ester lyase [Sulfolobaceae archaeon]